MTGSRGHTASRGSGALWCTAGRATVWFTIDAAGLIHTYRYYSDGGFGDAYGPEIAASGTAPLVTPAAIGRGLEDLLWTAVRCSHPGAAAADRPDGHATWPRRSVLGAARILSDWSNCFSS